MWAYNRDVCAIDCTHSLREAPISVKAFYNISKTIPLWNADIRTVFTTISTLRQQLSKVKDPDPMLSRAGVVYRIPCSCGKQYIGETKRALGVRLKEHQAATRRGEVEKSAISEYAWEEKHHPAWDEIAILE